MTNKIRSNIIVNIVRTLVLTLFSFITFPWACRYLGEATIGVYNWILTFVSFFLILAKVGIPNLAVRECVKYKDDKEKLSNKVQTFFVIQLITTVLSFGLMCLPVFLVPELRENSSIAFILSLNFLTGVFSFEWLFIALEKQFYMSIRTIIILTLCSILTIAFISNPDDIYIYCLITISVTILTTICNLFYLRKFVSLKKTMPYDFKPLLKPLAIICALSLTLSLYNQLDTFILGFIDKSKVHVASYSVGIKGIDIIIGIIASLSTVFIPRAESFFELEDKTQFKEFNKYSLNVTLFILFPAVATMTVLSQPICGLIAGVDYADPNQYVNAPLVLVILASMMVTYSISDMIYGQILLPQKKEKFYLFAILGGTILNAILSVVLGKFVFVKNPSIGVALGTIFSDILVLIFLISVSSKFSVQMIFNKNNLKLLLSSILVGCSSFGLLQLINFIFRNVEINTFLLYGIDIAAIILIEAGIYIGLLALTKEDITSRILHTNKRRQKDA